MRSLKTEAEAMDKMSSQMDGGRVCHRPGSVLPSVLICRTSACAVEGAEEANACVEVVMQGRL